MLEVLDVVDLFENKKALIFFGLYGTPSSILTTKKNNVFDDFDI